MAILVTVDVKVKADSADAMKALLAEIVADTRTYDGNHGITAYVNEDGRSFLLIQNWESKAKFEKYLGWRRETGMLDRVGALVEGPPDTRYFEALDA